jgi:hypothetical protein
MVGKEIRVNSRGILNTPTMKKEISTHNNQERLLQEIKNNVMGD